VASKTTPAWQKNFAKSYAMMVVAVLAFSAVLGGLFLGVQSLAEGGGDWIQRATTHGFKLVLVLDPSSNALIAAVSPAQVTATPVVFAPTSSHWFPTPGHVISDAAINH
jgi:hypothetical protein